MTTPQNYMAMIEQARVEIGLTQVTLAKAVGLSKQHYSHYASGRKVPSATMVARLADALGLELRQRPFHVPGKAAKRRSP